MNAIPPDWQRNTVKLRFWHLLIVSRFYTFYPPCVTQFGLDPMLLHQGSDSGQVLAFHPFQERAAGSRDISEVIGYPGLI